MSECRRAGCSREATVLVHLEDTGSVLVFCDRYETHLDDGQDYGPYTAVEPPTDTQSRLDRYDEA